MKKIILAAVTVSLFTLSSAWAADDMKKDAADGKTEMPMEHKGMEMKKDGMEKEAMPMEKKEMSKDSMEMKKDDMKTDGMEKKS